MIDLNTIPAAKEDLDTYEVNNLFHSWGYQPDQPPLRVLTAEGGITEGFDQLFKTSRYAVIPIIGADQIDVIALSPAGLDAFADASIDNGFLFVNNLSGRLGGVRTSRSATVDGVKSFAAASPAVK